MVTAFLSAPVPGAASVGAARSQWAGASCAARAGGRAGGSALAARPRRAVVMQADTGSVSLGPDEDGESNPVTAAAAEAVIDAAVDEMGPEDLKKSILKMANGSNRGAALSRKEREYILGMIYSLEAAGREWVPPAVDDTDEGGDALVGKWRLVFTNALDVLSLAVLPFSVGQIYQNVDAPGVDGRYTITNEVVLEPFFSPITNSFKRIPQSRSVVKVTAKGKLTGGEDSSKLDIVFVKSALEGITLLGRDLSNLPKLEVPLNSPVGFIETPYIDDDIRIARAPPTPNAPSQDNYFVLLRE